MKRIFAVAAVAAAACITLAACTGTGQVAVDKTSGTTSGASSLNLTYAVVTHSGPGDAFWDRVKAGAEKAGTDYGVKVTYNADPDPAKQSQLIDNAAGILGGIKSIF